MSQRQLTIEIRISEQTGQGSHRLQMWVSQYQDIDPEVFVYQRRPPVPPATADDDVYVNIASAADMVEYPATNPDTQIGPYFRLSSIDLLFRSVDLLNTSLDRMKADLRNLIANLDHLDLQAAEDQLVITGEVIP